MAAHIKAQALGNVFGIKISIIYLLKQAIGFINITPVMLAVVDGQLFFGNNRFKRAILKRQFWQVIYFPVHIKLYQS